MAVVEVDSTVQLDDQDLFNKEYRYAVLQVATGKFESSYNSLSEQQRFEVETVALKQCEIQRRVLGSAEAAKVMITPDRLEQEVQTIISRYADTAEFEKELAENELDLDSFPLLVKRSLKVEAVMDYIALKAEDCSEITARLYYYMNTDKFRQPELRKARHILITINPDYSENSREEVIKRSTVIATRLKNKPSRFAEQAQKYSECPTAMNGGELGLIKKGSLFPTLDKTLFEMKAGQVSNIVESPMGFHVLLCEEIQEEGFVSISKALPVIIEKMNERNRKSYQREWLSELFKAR